MTTKKPEIHARNRVIVIGAGVGGVATAARLAKAGFDVTVVEKNDHVGGRCSLLHHNGYRFDQGPSLLLLPGIFEEYFRDLGTSLAEEGIKLHKCEPNYNIWFHDGRSFQLSSDLARMKPEIEKYEGKAGFMRYLEFLRESHQHYEASVVHVLHRNFSSYFSMLRPGFLLNIFTLHPFQSIYTRAKIYFWTERLRRVFTFGSMYMGMSPYEAPGTYSLLQYTELAEGIWYPEGGFNKIPATIADVSRRHGVNYHLSTSVASIDVDSTNTNVTGVTLSDGTVLHASTVICNADLVYSYKNLLPQSSYSQSLSARPASCSSLSFYWALDTKILELKAHNIFLAKEYRQSFDQIFHDQSLPTEPSFYVNVPSRVDPTAAPEGKDTVVVLCPVGHLLAPESATGSSFLPWNKKKGLAPKSQREWESLVDRAREAVLDTIEKRIHVHLRKHILHEELNTPFTWREKFNLDKGAILGLSHSFFNVLCFRPATKHATLKGLYFCGASTHPGTGVPIVLAGSRIVADQVIDDKAKEPGSCGLLAEEKRTWGEWDARAYELRGASWRKSPQNERQGSENLKLESSRTRKTFGQGNTCLNLPASGFLDSVQPSKFWRNIVILFLILFAVGMWQKSSVAKYIYAT